ncbi:MAG: acyl-[acyl-carrier-protein]--UDP-N-acetylglucosamine O-acyltransferase [Candidatus Hydrogenedentota bacterium]
MQAYSLIGPGVTIGAGTLVGPHCVIDGRTVIGERNQIYSGAQIGVRSQDLKHDLSRLGRLEIGDGNVIREHVSISASTQSNESEDARITRIGSGCLLMTCSHVAHDCSVGDGVIIANCVALAGHVTVEDRAILGGLSAVHQFVQVGTFAMVGGMSRIWNDAPPYMITDGNPARCGGLNLVGLKRAGFDEASRARLKQIYRIMFRSDLTAAHALQEIESTVGPGPERDHFIAFVKKSARGLTRPRSSRQEEKPAE